MIIIYLTMVLGSFDRALNGIDIVDYLTIRGYRQDDKLHPNPYKKIAQEGGQEKLLQSNADITIYGGMRGGGKSYALLMDALNDCQRKGFSKIFVRK